MEILENLIDSDNHQNYPSYFMVHLHRPTDWPEETNTSPTQEVGRACSQKKKPVKGVLQVTRLLVGREKTFPGHSHPIVPGPEGLALGWEASTCVASGPKQALPLPPATLESQSGISPFPLAQPGKRVTPRIFKPLYQGSLSSWIRVSRRLYSAVPFNTTDHWY